MSPAIPFRFLEIALPCRDVEVTESCFVSLRGASAVFRGRMGGRRSARLLAFGTTLIFREDPEWVVPPAPQGDRRFDRHLGLRVSDLDAAIVALEARGARFVLTPAMARERRRSAPTGGAPSVETAFIAPPLTRERIDAGEYRHEVAIFEGPDGLLVELDEIHQPPDTGGYPEVQA